MTLTAGCMVRANDTYTKVIDLYECPPLFIYHNLMLEFAMQRWGGGGGELIPRRRCQIGMQLTYKEAQMLRNEDQVGRGGRGGLLP